MKIEVTREHIQVGDQGNPATCALALAVMEASGFPATVTGKVIYLDRGDGTLGQINMPEWVRDWRAELDAGERMHEITWHCNVTWC